MKANHEHSVPNAMLQESNPRAYFEQLLRQLNELEDWVDNRDEEELTIPDYGRQEARR